MADRVGFEPTSRLRNYLISSQSRYPDFEGKQRKLTDNARVCKPLKNQHFSALEGRKSRKPRQSKEFERNPVLGRKKPVGEKMGRTRGELGENSQSNADDTYRYRTSKSRWLSA